MRHNVSHTGKKQFNCDICHKLFSRKDNLNKHKKLVEYEFDHIFVYFDVDLLIHSKCIYCVFLLHIRSHEQKQQVQQQQQPQQQQQQQTPEPVQQQQTLVYTVTAVN